MTFNAELMARNKEQEKNAAMHIAETQYNRCGGTWHVVIDNGKYVVTQEPGDREIYVTYEE